jgi:hypothetical protein
VYIIHANVESLRPMNGIDRKYKVILISYSNTFGRLATASWANSVG